MNATLRIRCPSCRAEHPFPAGLIGPEGARVACPSCGERFLVAPAGVDDPVVRPERAPEAPRDRASLEPGRDPAVAAIARLEPYRVRVRAAAEAGRLFAEFGPELLAAFDDYARAAGTGASRRAFARAVEARLGVVLPLAEDTT